MGFADADGQGGSGAVPIALSLLDLMPDAIVQRDASGRILFANAAYARLIPGGSDLVGSSIRPLVVQSGKATIRPDGVREVDEAITVAGELRWFAFAETDVTLPDGTIATLRSGREITTRVITEQALGDARVRAEAASDAKSRFLATISHEFRTPLNGILGMASLLQETGLDAEQATYVHAVRSSAEAFLSLIEEVLDFSKIEAGRIDLVDKPFEIDALVEGVVELLAPRAQGKGVEISGFVAAQVPRRLVGDRDRLRQVLFNLAGNAVKFTEAGGVGLSLERDADTGELVFAIEDTGPGIAPGRLQSIFEEFEQEANPSRDSGTGLGLAITRRIVEHMGGRVGVESVVGEGSRFEVRLSLPAAPGATAPEPDLGIAGANAIILAPSAFQAGFLARALGEAGLRTSLVETVEMALAALESRPCEILVADCALGEAAVRQVAEAARRHGVRRTIVLLSPFERRDFGSPHAAGFDAYLIKPVRSRSLRAQLRPHSPPRAVIERRPTLLAPVRRRAVRVLLAEDNDVNALLAVKALERLGALVDWAKDGAEALDFAEAALADERPRYDLILMDVRMPKLDGFAVTRRIRAREARDGQVASRIVALTASILRGDEAAGRAAGFDGFLAKPFTFDALRAQLPSDDDLAQAS